MSFVFYLHLLAATVWVGGLIVVAGLIPAVRRATDDREVLRAVARRFGIISWIALGVLVPSGLWLAADQTWDGLLVTKFVLVVVSAILAGWHTVAARNQSPALRGAIQGVILVLALVILALAINV